MKKHTAITLFCVALLILPMSYAQDNAAEVPFDNAAETEAEEAEKEAGENDSAAKQAQQQIPAQKESEQKEPEPVVNPDATFTPTEEISEDQPVPFPVDI